MQWLSRTALVAVTLVIPFAVGCDSKMTSSTTSPKMGKMDPMDKGKMDPADKMGTDKDKMEKEKMDKEKMEKEKMAK